MSMKSLFKEMLSTKLYSKKYLIGKLNRIRAFGDQCCTQDEYEEILILIDEWSE